MDEFTFRLGKIVINFTCLETFLQTILSKLISNDAKIGAIIISEMSFQNQLKIFDSLIKYKYEKNQFIINNAEEIRKQLNEAEQLRNTYLHSFYLIEKDQKNIHKIKISSKQKNGLKINDCVIDITNIDSDIKKISSAVKKLQSFFKELYPNEEFVII